MAQSSPWTGERGERGDIPRGIDDGIVIGGYDDDDVDDGGIEDELDADEKLNEWLTMFDVSAKDTGEVK